MSVATAAFSAALPFGLDPFQREACELVEAGHSVLVAAPTGAGKTIVAEFAIHLTLAAPTGRVFYTTPMKALSNQKFRELQAVYGDDAGLLTGDTSIRGDARVVVMTTEVLRNMLYEGRDLSDLEHVVMDEVHYLADRFRGAVWEEVIIHLPRHVAMVSLSATVSNAEEFGAWLQAVRGDTSIVVSEHRPVPLDAHVLVRDSLVPLFDSRRDEADHRPSRELVERTRGSDASAAHGHRDRGGHNRHVRRGQQGRRGQPRGAVVRDRYDWRGDRPRRLDRVALVRTLQERSMLPAIDFIFSRKGCDAAVEQVVRGGVRLTSAEQRAEIRALVEERTHRLDDADLAVLGYFEWLDGLEAGVAAHHAGLLPIFKEIVEELFQRRLVQVVFATETLALGINMPARTVVLEQLEKFNGEARVRITPGEYTQLTGRAGRRGIDTEGHAVVAWTGDATPQEIAGLASRRSYPLTSSFRPTYNMAVNLIDRFGIDHTRELLETSFAQFQADRSVVQLARKVTDQRQSLAGYAKAAAFDVDGVAEYAGLRRSLSDLERDAARAGLSHAEREAAQGRLRELRGRMRSHAAHAHPDREARARWGERYHRLHRDIEATERQISRRTGQVAERFTHIVGVLETLDYVTVGDDGHGAITPAGDTLRRIYGERDLLIAEALRRGIWHELDAAGLAALVCALVFEPRRGEQGSERALPGGAFRDALEATVTLWAELDELERSHRLPGSEPPQTGLSAAVHRWARGGHLDMVLQSTELGAGDFVRWVRQTIDVLEQIQGQGSARLRQRARDAVDRIRRGVVDLGQEAS